ncbi:short chain dehydrogenase/reductase family [Protomyces lactucae-debilis]|uniref:Short chain dehydrogenase/reductase family n=1 Tax=Protomyces lactucae-debilis TaxID=2754530 RepID=A0A1Y2ES46_PROLT|nr:short chain dehydrogenase/reductase family [Protomyces lactucae-debilis]ORY74104.1 short chain dehydrogenase/reductase family [Protomyces lactucae-debilis]
MSSSRFQIEKLFNVKGKVALVTGGSTGIGLMCAQALAVNGAKVYIVGRKQDKLDNAVKTHGTNLPSGGSLVPLVGDVTSKDSIKNLVKQVEAQEKCLCILVNNAGISATSSGPQAENAAGGSEVKSSEGLGETAQELKDNLFDAVPFEAWDDVFRTNVAAMYFTSIDFLPLLSRAAEHQHGFSGCIINICSISGLTKQSQNHFAYNASKAAAIHINKMLAVLLGERHVKVRVSAISPGVFPSQMTASEEPDEANKSTLDKDMLKEIPAERPGRDEDMAQACLFLACNQYVNGVNIPVDGGYLLVRNA